MLCEAPEDPFTSLRGLWEDAITFYGEESPIAQGYKRLIVQLSNIEFHFTKNMEDDYYWEYDHANRRLHHYSGDALVREGGLF